MTLQVLDGYIGVTVASRLLELSAARVQQLADSGVIDAIRDPSGRRLLVLRSVQKLAERRRRSRGIIRIPEHAADQPR